MDKTRVSRVKGVGVIRCTVISATYRVVKVIGPTTDSSVYETRLDRWTKRGFNKFNLGSLTRRSTPIPHNLPNLLPLAARDDSLLILSSLLIIIMVILWKRNVSFRTERER